MVRDNDPKSNIVIPEGPGIQARKFMTLKPGKLKYN